MGGFAEIIVKICKPLIAARITNSANTAKMALMTFARRLHRKNLDDRVCATSCISWFA